MADIEVTYDRQANAAYISFAEPGSEPAVARMYPCDPVEVGGMINLDFDENGRLVGVEVLAARSKLPQYMLDAADRIDPGAG
ncbi:DUF2283 domain-containing protein [Streptomyces guryensis]|uniref:DUF2283 domain-containing protein n=1 Tax=Streptomyces guryensis TaxID=2886947 RepID=A0A9Q3VQS9_9ACTN|nr:DUF2283 domain-containing protein [Streptomyces guryensis]MCD9875435.1 DUF2283 domain-containing protein [Streptomyces guryensis]